MKILYVCTSTDTGGAEISLYQLACACKAQGHQVKVISLKPLGPVAEKLQNKNIETISFGLKGTVNLIEAANLLSRLVRQIEEFQPNIVHASLFRAIQFCRMAKKYTNFRLVVTPHYDLSKKSLFCRFVDRALKQYDDISCAESALTASFLKKNQRYKTEKVRLIPNGVDISIFKPNLRVSNLIRKKLGFSKENIIFTCVSRLSPEKNHSLLLDSFAALQSRKPQVRLLLVGDGPEKEKLQQAVLSKNMEKTVVFVGEVSNVNEFLSASDVFILVSCIESLPIALLEACSSALPSIVSKVGDMPNIVIHGKTGFVCNTKDSVLLTVLMAELAENADLRQQMGKKSREYIKQNYSLPIKSYLKIYEEIK